MVVHRGEIWWADMPAHDHAGPAYRRPVLVMQDNFYNRSRISSVVCVALTSNLRLADAPGNVVLPSRDTDLPKDSVANVSQIATLDKAFLEECVGVLPEHLLYMVEEGVRMVLGL